MPDARLKEHDPREGKCLILVKCAARPENYRGLDKWVRTPQDRTRLLRIDKTSAIASLLHALSVQESRDLRQGSIATS